MSRSTFKPTIFSSDKIIKLVIEENRFIYLRALFPKAYVSDISYDLKGDLKLSYRGVDYSFRIPAEKNEHFIQLDEYASTDIMLTPRLEVTGYGYFDGPADYE